MRLFQEDGPGFEKQAAIAKLSDNPENWGQEITAELHRNLPYLHRFTVEVRVDRVDPERGFGIGAAIVANRTMRTAVEALQGGQISYSRIPLIIKGYFLQPLDVFLYQNDVLPLTEERFNEVMFRPEVFDAVRVAPSPPSLIGSLFPPVFARQGYEGFSSGVPDLNKISSAQEGDHGLPILSSVSKAINQEDLGRFTAVLEDPGVRAAVRRNGYFAKAASILSQAHVWSEEDTSRREAALRANIPPTVMQVRHMDDGTFQVKYANAEMFDPQTEVMTPTQASKELGADIVSRAESDGTVTVASDSAVKHDSTLEKVEAAKDFGEYRVKNMANEQLLGWVFPSVFDFRMTQLPLCLFTNGSETALQENVAGSRVGQGTNVPVKVPETGDYGCLVFFDKGRAQASIPFEVTALADGKLYTTDDLGERMCFSYSPGLNVITPVGNEGNTVHYAVPDFYEFMPLSRKFVELQPDPELFNKMAAADYFSSMVKVAMDTTGCVSLDGLPVSNLDPHERSFIDVPEAEFLLAAMGAEEPAVKLAEAKVMGGVMVKVARILIPYHMQKAAATYGAAKFVQELPRIPKGAEIIKIAAAVPDAATVDSLLSLNFATPENLLLLGEMLPKFEATQRRVASLLLSARLGVEQLPEGALEKAMFYLEEVIKSLKGLAGGFTTPTGSMSAAV